MTGVLDNKKINYRVMGEGNISLHLSMPKYLLETYGAHVSLSDLEMCLEIIKEYVPWFTSDDNLMDMENWVWLCLNVGEAANSKTEMTLWSDTD